MMKEKAQSLDVSDLVPKPEAFDQVRKDRAPSYKNFKHNHNF